MKTKLIVVIVGIMLGIFGFAICANAEECGLPMGSFELTANVVFEQGESVEVITDGVIKHGYGSGTESGTPQSGYLIECVDITLYFSGGPPLGQNAEAQFQFGIHNGDGSWNAFDGARNVSGAGIRSFEFNIGKSELDGGFADESTFLAFFDNVWIKNSSPVEPGWEWIFRGFKADFCYDPTYTPEPATVFSLLFGAVGIAMKRFAKKRNVK